MLTTMARPGAYLWCSAPSWPLGRCLVKGSRLCSPDRNIHFCQDKTVGAAFLAMCLTAPRQQKEPAQRPKTLRLVLPKAA